MKSSIFSLLSAAGLAAAQQTVWGQCGGINWTGPTTCTSGNHCEKLNDWYWQCLPGAATTTPQQPTTTTRTTTTTTRPTTTTTTNNPPAGTGFPSRSGTKFTIDGVTKYFAGTNCYWCPFLTSNSDVDLVFDHLRTSGIKILRIWGFNDVNSVPSGQVYFQHLTSSGSTINTGSNGLQRLDYVVSAAQSRGIKLIINFVNNWDDYGGMKAYTNAFGGDHNGWYTNSAAQTQYKKYINAVVSRYRNSNAILAWELANEPRCQQCDTSVIYNWAKSTSEYVKSLDSNHMVTLGDEGFGLSGDGSYPYTYYEGVDFQKNLEISTLDFGTFHMYPDHWGVSSSWGNDWIRSHAALCAAANKPCLLEEYGIESNKCSIEGQWQATSRGAAGMGGDAFWQLGDTLSTGQTHNDGFTIYYGSSDWQCLVTNHVAAIG